MGAIFDTEFTDDPHESAQEAYTTLRDEMARVYGQDDPSGTIATSSGVRECPVAHALTEEEALAHAKTRQDALQPWGVYEAVPLATVTPATLTNVREHTITLTVSPDAVEVDGWQHSDETRSILAGKLGVTPHDIQSVALPSAHLNPSAWETTVTHNPGATRTRYVVKRSERHMPPSVSIVGVYDTMDEATAAATAYTRRYANMGNTAHIVELVERADGQPCTTITSTPTEYTATFTVVTAHVAAPQKIDRTTRSGWLLYGWAAD